MNSVSTHAGSLIVVGTGIQAAGQLTIESRGAIERAEKLFYLVSHPTTAFYLEKLNASAESLKRFYETDKDRYTSYLEMVDHILAAVRSGLRVCVALYGHPGVFSFPSHEAIRRARREGYTARMLPGVSAEDCLFADLGIDPANAGCQSFEATDFLIFGRTFDPNSSLILWQIGVIGDLTFQAEGYGLSGVTVLSEHLERFYGAEHSVIVYEAALVPIHDPVKQVVGLGQLPAAKITATSTLFVPPKGPATMDTAMLKRLGMDPARIQKIVVDLSLEAPTKDLT